MSVLFVKTFVHAGQQLVVQRRILPISCPCGRPSCGGIVLVNGVTIMTMIGLDVEELLPMIASENTAASAQQLLDLFEIADAHEALEILQAKHYEAENFEKSQERLLALRNTILSRIPAEQND